VQVPIYTNFNHAIRCAALGGHRETVGRLLERYLVDNPLVNISQLIPIDEFQVSSEKMKQFLRENLGWQSRDAGVGLTLTKTLQVCIFQ
jgi:hypothetical protein